MLLATVAPLASKRYYQTLRVSDKVPVIQITLPYKPLDPFLTFFVVFGALRGWSFFLFVLIYESAFVLVYPTVYFYLFYFLELPDNHYFTVASDIISTPWLYASYNFDPIQKIYILYKNY